MTTDKTYTGWKPIDASETRSEFRIAARQMGDLVRSTLGPLGLDKMVVRRMQDDELRFLVSNDGVSIIEEFEGETDHPIAQHVVRLAEEQESDYGDGTTTAVLLGTELLATGAELADRGVHPNDVVRGFSIGAQRTLESWEEQAIPLTTGDGTLDRDALETIATSGMTNGRSGSWPLAPLADVVVDAVLRVSDPERPSVDLSYSDTVTIPGGDVTDSTIVDGAILPETVVTGDRLLPVSDGALLIDGDLQPRSLDADVTIAADGAVADRATGGQESDNIAATIARANVAFVVATGDVAMSVADALASRGIVCLRNVKDSNFSYLARVTGGTPRGPVSPSTDIDPDHVGRATVRRRTVGSDDEWLEVVAPEDVENVPAATLVVRGGTETAAGEAERRVKDGKNALRAAILHPAALPAGGAAELAAASAVRSLAPRFEGREQLAIEGFADVLESIPRTLCANAGLDSLDAVTDLRSRHDEGHSRAGVSTDGALVDDVVAEANAIDPYRIKTTGLVRSVEFATSLVRIDGVLYDRRSDGTPLD